MFDKIFITQLRNCVIMLATPLKDTATFQGLFIGLHVVSLFCALNTVDINSGVYLLKS